MENSKQTTNPWEMMYEPFKGIYTKDEIDEMSFAEICELHDQYVFNGFNKKEDKNELNTK